MDCNATCASIEGPGIWTPINGGTADRALCVVNDTVNSWLYFGARAAAAWDGCEAAGHAALVQACHVTPVWWGARACSCLSALKVSVHSYLTLPACTSWGRHQEPHLRHRWLLVPRGRLQGPCEAGRCLPVRLHPRCRPLRRSVDAPLVLSLRQPARIGLAICAPLPHLRPRRPGVQHGVVSRRGGRGGAGAQAVGADASGGRAQTNAN